MRRMPFAFYNLAPPGDPNRGSVRVALESNAIVNNDPTDLFRRRPKVFGVCEAIGRSLPSLDRYDLLRDTSRASRANLAVYVLDHLDHGRAEWIDLKETWPRTEHPGTHPPRSLLVVRVEDWTVCVSHAPPTAPGAGPARAEWVKAARAFMAGPGPRLLLSDPNALPVDVAGVEHGGTPIEHAHVRGARLVSWSTPAEINGVRMLSDHKKALLGLARLR